jgi:hypothetical protein
MSQVDRSTDPSGELVGYDLEKVVLGIHNNLRITPLRA